MCTHLLVRTLQTSTTLDNIVATLVSLARVMVGMKGATVELISTFEKQLAEGALAIPAQLQDNVAEFSVAELHALSFVDLYKCFIKVML